MLVPADYDEQALHHPLTRRLMEQIEFRHGGPEYDAQYPDGIPTTLEIEHARLGHAFQWPGDVSRRGMPATAAGNWTALLEHKFRLLAGLGVVDVDGLYRRFTGLAQKTAGEIAELYDFEIRGLSDA